MNYPRRHSAGQVFGSSFKTRWGTNPVHGSTENVKPLPCCETFPLDTGSRIDDTPEALKQFLHQIEIVPEEEKVEKLTQKKIAALRGKPRMSSNPSSSKNSRRNSAVEVEIEPVIVKTIQKFTEMEIVTLWNKFKFDFPTGNVNQKQLLQLFKQVFPRCNNTDEIVENLLLVFDHNDTGVVSFREVLILFSMSMDGSPRDKLHWAFRLYDQDGDDLLQVEDMIDIFKRLWRLAANMDKDQLKKKREKKHAQDEENNDHQNRSPPEKGDKTTDKKGNNKKKVWKPSPNDTKLEVPVLAHKLSSKSSNIKPKRTAVSKQGPKKVKPEAPPTPPKEEEEGDPEDALPEVNPADRARELFESLDVDADGVLTEDEFVEGCLTDPNFLAVLETFNCDFIWGV